jgi:hypothetical protein
VKIFFVRFILAACLTAGAASATPFFIYNSPANGQTVQPAIGATSYSTALATSWIFGEVSVDPSYVGQPMWGNAVRMTNPTLNSLNVGVLTGVWAADGVGGNPGTLLSIAQTATFSFANTNNAIIVYSNFAIPAGNFWMGYAFETVGSSPATTATELNSIGFDLSNGPTVGASASQALLGSQVGAIGSNPTISGPAGGYLSQAIQMYAPDVQVPEPSSLVLGTCGFFLVAGTGFYRRRATI